MCSARPVGAASATDADAPIERGSAVIVSRTLFAIVPPLGFMRDLSPCCSNEGEGCSPPERRAKWLISRTSFSPTVRGRTASWSAVING